MLTGRNDRRHIFDTAFVGLLSVALYAVFPAFSDIYRLWNREAGVSIVAGLGQGQFEYPPLAALYFEPLAHLPSARWAVVVHGLVMVIAALGVTWALNAALDRGDSSSRSDIRVWVMSPALLLFLPINWDVGVAYVTVVALTSLYARREFTAGLLHGAGTALKVYPAAMVLPIAPLIEGAKRRILFLGGGLAVLASSYWAYILLRPGTWRTHLDLAASRPDFGSTIWGLIDWVSQALGGGGLQVAYVNTLSAVLVGLGLVTVTIWVAKTRPSFSEAAAMALLAFLLLNKVFKPQYVLWILPLLAWNGADRRTARLLEGTAVVDFAVTYFTLPMILIPMAVVIRVWALGSLGWELISRNATWRAGTVVRT